MKSVLVKSPTRVDLAGGTLDLWPLYNFVGEACTINVAIDIWTSCELTTLSENVFRVKSLDLNECWSFKDYSDFEMQANESLSFYKSVLRHFKLNFNKLKTGLEIKTTSQSPMGGGLGGSSSLVISTLKALHQYFEIELPSTKDLVFLAHNIEAEMLRTPTGTQDYFPAVTGGLNFIDYKTAGVQLSTQSVLNTPLKDYFLLVYTGRSHHSGLNNFEVFKSAVQGDEKVLSALRKIRDIASELKEAIKLEDWGKLPELFRAEYDARIQLTPAFTSPEIEKLHDVGLKAGALAVKICGAGGGGCVLLWVAPDKRQSVIEACEGADFKCLPAQPVEPL